MIPLLLLKGSRLVVFGTVWMLLTLAPLVFFTWANTSRYMYQPSLGFSLILAQGVVHLGQWLERRQGRRVAVAAASVLALGLAARFSVFARANVAEAAVQWEYRDSSLHLAWPAGYQ